jgi:hypothetical protein
MTIEEIKCEEDILLYIKGTLNDFDTAVTTHDQAEWDIVNLISWAVRKDRENRLNLEKIKP